MMYTRPVIATVLSEEFQDGRILEGVRFRNSFGPGFDVEALASG
jgi:hypothetical protein